MKSLLTVLALILLSNQVFAQSGLEEQAQLAGLAYMCAEKSGIPKPNDDSDRLLGQKIMEPYKDLGIEAANIFTQNVSVGLAMADATTPAGCEAILGKFITLIEGLGLDTIYWKKLAQHYNSELVATGFVQLETGVYKAKGHKKDLPEVFLSVYNTGEIMSNDPSPFMWIQEGKKLALEFINLPKEESQVKCDITGPTTFIWKDSQYEKDKNINVFEYSYEEPASSGHMAIFDSGDNAIDVKIETAADNGNTCEVFMEACSKKGGKIICHPLESEDPEIMLIISQNSNMADLSGTINESDYCGNAGAFMGKYKKVGE